MAGQKLCEKTFIQLKISRTMSPVTRRWNQQQSTHLRLFLDCALIKKQIKQFESENYAIKKTVWKIKAYIGCDKPEFPRAFWRHNKNYFYDILP